MRNVLLCKDLSRFRGWGTHGLLTTFRDGIHLPVAQCGKKDQKDQDQQWNKKQSVGRFHREKTE